MGTISEKLTYLNETKQELKQAINNLGGDITDSTTFRQYAEELQDIYDVLPKTEFQEGTDVTIEGGLKGKIDFDDGKVGFGQASQDSTKGYQLINPSQLPLTTNGVTISKDTKGNIVLNGTPSISEGYINFRYSAYLNLSPNTYTLSVANKKVGIGIIVSSSEFGGELNLTFADTSKSKSKAISNNTSTDVQVNVRYDVGTLNNFILNPMLEEGSTAHDYEKYTGGYASPSPNWEQPIQCVTGNQEIVVSGKNLFDDSVERKNAYPSQTIGSEVTYGTSSATYSYVKCAEITKGITYTISWEQDTTPASTSGRIGVIVDNNNVVLATQGTWINSATYITFTATVSGKLILATDINTSNIQIEEGSTSSDYEPYHTPITYPISLGSNKFYKIGDYADELLYDVDEDKVYKNEKIGKLVLNGSENYTESSSQPTSNLKFYLLQDIPDAKYLDGNSYVVGSALNNYLKDFDQNDYAGRN